jgi:hypothetical protein
MVFDKTRYRTEPTYERQTNQNEYEPLHRFASAPLSFDWVPHFSPCGVAPSGPWMRCKQVQAVAAQAIPARLLALSK